MRESRHVEIFRVNGELSYVDPWTKEIKRVCASEHHGCYLKPGAKLEVTREIEEDFE